MTPSSPHNLALAIASAYCRAQRLTARGTVRAIFAAYAALLDEGATEHGKNVQE